MASRNQVRWLPPACFERNGHRVRLITRGGYDWTKRFPWIVEAALKNRQKHFVIDGEAVILGVDGISDFDALHSGRRSAHLTFWQSLAMICGAFRYQCARQIWRDRLHAAPRTFSLVDLTERDWVRPVPQSVRIRT
jgi:hypothetical protein